MSGITMTRRHMREIGKDREMAELQIPENLLYTEDHEWIERLGPTTVRVGITDYAQDALNDIVFVQLPEIGQDSESGEPLGELESTKSFSDVYAPLSGVVRSINEELIDSPELLNSDPYGEGWILVIEAPSEADLQEQLEALLDPDAYAGVTQS